MGRGGGHQKSKFGGGVGKNFQPIPHCHSNWNCPYQKQSHYCGMQSTGGYDCPLESVAQQPHLPTALLQCRIKAKHCEVSVYSFTDNHRQTALGSSTQ